MLAELAEIQERHLDQHRENDKRIVAALKHNKRRTDALVAVVRQLALLVLIYGTACCLLLVIVAILWLDRR